MGMNSIEVTYRQVSNGSSGNGFSGGGVERSSNKTGTFHFFSKNTISKLPGVKVHSTGLKIGGALKFGAVGVAISQTMNLVDKVAQPVLQVYSAKTGETMKANNIRSTLQIIRNPIGMFKRAIWDNGYIRNLELARENQALQNERDLSGKIILQKQYQKSLL